MQVPSVFQINCSLERFVHKKVKTIKLGLRIKVRKVTEPKHFERLAAHTHTAYEEPATIQHKCLVPIYLFPEMKLRILVISKTEL